MWPAEPNHGVIGAIGAMLITAIVGIWEVGRRVLKTRWARRMLGAVLNLERSGEVIPKEKEEMSAALLEILRRMETDRQEEARQRDRQWERVEDVVSACRDLAASLQAFIKLFEVTQANHAQTMQRIEDSQVSMAQWVYQNWPRSASSAPHYPPPSRGRAAGG